MKVNFTDTPAVYGSAGAQKINAMPKNSAKNNLTLTSNLASKLPSYDMSFGMAKIVRSYDYVQNTLDYDTRSEIKEFCFKMAETRLFNSNNEFDEKLNEFRQRIKDASDNEIKYYLKKACLKVCYSEINTWYLEAFIQAYRENNFPETRKQLTNDILTAKDVNGDTLLHALANSSNEYGEHDLIVDIIDMCDDYPELQYRILDDKNEEGQTALTILSDNLRPNERYTNITYEKMNRAVYNLATQAREISPAASRELLEDNQAGLNVQNNDVRNMYMSGDYEVESDE